MTSTPLRDNSIQVCIVKHIHLPYLLSICLCINQSITCLQHPLCTNQANIIHNRNEQLNKLAVHWISYPITKYHYFFPDRVLFPLTLQLDTTAYDLTDRQNEYSTKKQRKAKDLCIDLSERWQCEKQNANNHSFHTQRQLFIINMKMKVQAFWKPKRKIILW